MKKNETVKKEDLKKYELNDEILDKVTGGSSSCHFIPKTDPKTGKTVYIIVC